MMGAKCKAHPISTYLPWIELSAYLVPPQVGCTLRQKLAKSRAGSSVLIPCCHSCQTRNQWDPSDAWRNRNTLVDRVDILPRGEGQITRSAQKEQRAYEEQLQAGESEDALFSDPRPPALTETFSIKRLSCWKKAAMYRFFDCLYPSRVLNLLLRSATIRENSSSVAWRSSAISAAITSRSRRLSEPSRLVFQPEYDEAGFIALDRFVVPEALGAGMIKTHSARIFS